MDFNNVVVVAVSAVWFLLPSYVANMAPVAIARLGWLQQLATPMDGYCEFRGRRVLGNNKTWRGLYAGIIAGLITVSIQQWFFKQYVSIQAIAIFDYRQGNIFLLGLLLGAGAMAGDATESFIKRQRDFPEGYAWRPWDQIDQTLGALALVSFFFVPPTAIIVAGLTVTFLGVILVNQSAYFFGIKSVPW